MDGVAGRTSVTSTDLMTGFTVPYERLFFDLDGVLLDFHAAEAAALQSAFRTAGIVFEARWLESYRDVNARFWKALEQGAKTPDQIKRERFPAFLEAINLKTDPVAMGRKYLEALGACSDLLGNPFPVLAMLKKRFPLTLITNGLKSVQERRLDASGLRPYFDHIVISEDVGLAKPDPAIFTHTLHLNGNPDPCRVLMIGDSLSSDIAGAKAAGIHSCWFNPDGLSLPADAVQPDMTIHALEQLL